MRLLSPTERKNLIDDFAKYPNLELCEKYGLNLDDLGEFSRKYKLKKHPSRMKPEHIEYLKRNLNKPLNELSLFMDYSQSCIYDTKLKIIKGIL